MRIEKDHIGEVEIEKDALYGIHSKRAKDNFPYHNKFHQEWYKAVGLVKLACYYTYKNFKSAINSKVGLENSPIELIDDNDIEVLIKSATEVSIGKYYDSFIVPAISGGAGTSINMNINEIIANASLLKLEKKPGDYDIIDPIEHSNIFQSTNDVIPTALKVATMQLLNTLEDDINKLRIVIEGYEKKHRNDLRIAYTQMQEAVPSSFGRLFSTYNEALSRDWWRVSKCFERIKVVNIGGSAVGTGITVPKYFIMNVVNQLQQLTSLPITRSENLSDATNNLDSFVEVHAIIKSHAVNLEKISNDIRLLASDIHDNEISIPNKQVGSSIMPGKVNPVISEYVISAAHKVYANDMLISNLSAQGCLDLNAYIPIIGNAILESLKLMISANNTLRKNVFSNVKVNTALAYNKLINSPAITTALLPYIGYNKAAEIALVMKENNLDIIKANENIKVIDSSKLEELLLPQNLLKEGFSLDDL